MSSESNHFSDEAPQQKDGEPIDSWLERYKTWLKEQEWYLDEIEMAAYYNDFEHEFVRAIAKFIDRDLMEQFESFVESLEPREKTILSKRFGLFGETPTPLLDLGEEFGITVDRVMQIMMLIRSRLIQLDWATQIVLESIDNH